MAYSDEAARADRLFPLLGFPGETNARRGEIVYECWLGSEARIAVWQWKMPTHNKRYALNLYHHRRTEKIDTHVQDRYCLTQAAIDVDDAFEAQLAINYLIQKHLPEEVINDINSTREAERQSA